MSRSAEMLFGAAIARNAAARPSSPALSFNGNQWTYAEFDAWIDNVAAQLGALGVAPGDCVVHVSSPRPEVFATMFALARLGAAFVPVHASSTPVEITRIMDHLRPVGVVADAPAWAKLGGCPAAQRGWNLEIGGSSRPALSTETHPPDAPVVRPAVDPGSTTAVIAHTSGTSGQAKAVRLTHANLMWSAINGLAQLDVVDTDRTLVTTPLSHIAVLSGLAHYTWIQGGQVVLTSGFDVESFYDIVAGTGITLAFAVPTMLELLARNPRFTGPALDPLRWVLSGGAPMAAATRARYADRGTTIVDSYGLTEASAGIAYGTGGDARTGAALGTVAPFAEVRIVTADGSPAATGEAGEILVRGPSVATDYLGPGRQPIAAVDADGWFHSGDRGVLDQRARLAVSGRLKETIITGGENVDPFEVEQELSRFPGIAEAVVVGVQEPTWGQVVTAVVVTEDGFDPDLDQISRWLAPQLSSFKIPRRLVTRAELPRNATGKLLRRRLVEEIEDADRQPGDQPA